VCPAFVAVLDDYIVIDPYGPARFPAGDVILQMDAKNALVFSRDRCQTSLEAGVVISERPNLAGLTGCGLDLPHPLFDCAKFVFNFGVFLPPHCWVTGNSRAIEGVTIHNDGNGV
jgi:hypothetical protein